MITKLILEIILFEEKMLISPQIKGKNKIKA